MARQASVPLATARSAASTTSAPPRPDKPVRFTYALVAHTAERRIDGWWIAATPFGGDKPRWSGPFTTIETACLAIARRNATEIADRHTRSIEAHKMKSSDPLFGLRSTTRLRAKKTAGETDS